MGTTRGRGLSWMMRARPSGVLCERLTRQLPADHATIIPIPGWIQHSHMVVMRLCDYCWILQHHYSRSRRRVCCPWPLDSWEGGPSGHVSNGVELQRSGQVAAGGWISKQNWDAVVVIVSSSDNRRCWWPCWCCCLGHCCCCGGGCLLMLLLLLLLLLAALAVAAAAEVVLDAAAAAGGLYMLCIVEKVYTVGKCSSLAV